MAIYVITDGNKNYIRRNVSGKYVSARSRDLADEFIEKWKAEKVLKNNLTPKKRKLYRVIEEDVEAAKNPDKRHKEIGKFDATSIDALKENIENIKKIVSDAENRRSELSDLLSGIDKEITDIEHYIELKETDEHAAISTYEMLKNRLKNRRKIKNELSILRQLSICKMDVSTIDELLKYISDINNQTYTPRVLKDLF